MLARLAANAGAGLRARPLGASGAGVRSSSGVGDKITIAEARVRRTDPGWRRRYKLADLGGLALVLLLLLGAPLAGLLWRPLGVACSVALLVGAPLALWSVGPVVGLERRAALLVAVPVLNLFVLVPATWRFAHLSIQRWQGPLEPPWGDGVWWVAGAVGAACWLAAVSSLVLSLT